MVSEQAPVLKARINAIRGALHAVILQAEAFYPEGIGQVVVGHRFFQSAEEFDTLMVHRLKESGGNVIRGWQLVLDANNSNRGGDGVNEIAIGKLRRTYDFNLIGLHGYDPDSDLESVFYGWVEAVQDQLDAVVLLDGIPGQAIAYPKDDGTGYEVRRIPQNVHVAATEVDYDLVGGQDGEEEYWGLILHRAIINITVHEDLTQNRVLQ